MLEVSSAKKNAAFILYIAVIDTAARPAFRANPTIAAGDFQVSIDGGAYNNLTTLPVVTPAASISIMISLSAAEMNGNRITVKCIDAAGAEWDSEFIIIRPISLDNIADAVHDEDMSGHKVAGTNGALQNTIYSNAKQILQAP
jgi:hypothetical protein